MLFATGASAAIRVWDGGCGEDTSWSCAANWSEDTVPGEGDGAVFNGTATGASTVDPAFGGTVSWVAVEAGYTGTLSLERSLTALASLNQAGGSFTAAGQALSIGELTISGGSFTASSATTSVSGSMRISEGVTFDANGGTFEFGGITSGRLRCGGVVFNKVVFTHTARTKTVGKDCTMPLGADPLAGSGGSIKLLGTLSGSGTLTTTKTLNLGPGGVLSGFTGLAAFNLIVKGEYDFGEYAPFTVSRRFVLRTGGKFTAPSGVATFDKHFIIATGGVFMANGGTVEFDGTSAFRVLCGEQKFNLVVFNSTGRKTIGSDCTLPLGANPSLGSGGTWLGGTLTGSGELTQTGTFIVEGTEPGLSSFTDVTDFGSFKLNASAAMTAPAGTLTVNGDFIAEAGATFNANEGTVNFEPLTGGTETIACGEIPFNLVTVNNIGRVIVGSDCTLPLGPEPTLGGGGEIALQGALTGSGTLTVDSSSLSLRSTGSLTGFSGFVATGILSINGVYDFGEYAPFEVASHFAVTPGASFTAPSGTAKFGGNFNNVGPSFIANGGTVELIGTNQHISGSTTFNNLTKIATGEDVVTFKGGDTQTILGALILEGAEAGQHLSLVSSEPLEKTWGIAAEGTRTVKWVTVSDSVNAGETISAVESTDAGGNTGWEFP
ncbi:MAG: hypothetical protein ACM3N0_03250 [Chloroflexota bacterium]